jgi:outer membrane protein TolC
LGSDRGKREWEVELAVPLWLPGQKLARGAEADAALAEVTAQRQALRLQLAGELRQAWWALAAARATKDLAQRRLAGARALEADVTRRYRAGDLARVDANLAGNERLAAEAETLEAEAALARAELVWRNLTGAPAPARLEAESPLPASPAAGGGETDQLSGHLNNHPRLAALSAAARLAHARLKLAGETRRDAPELAMRVQRERSDANDSYGNSLGIKLTIPFSTDARVRQDNSAARADAARADAELALARLALARETEGARREVEGAERQLDLTRERQALITDNLALAEKAFALGESDLASLLRVRAATLEIEAAANRLRIARDASFSRLLQAMGVLP